MVLELTALGVARFVERSQYVARELASFVQYGVDQIGGDFFTTGQLGYLIKADQLLQDELHVRQRSNVGAHDFSSS